MSLPVAFARVANSQVIKRLGAELGQLTPTLSNDSIHDPVSIEAISWPIFVHRSQNFF